MLRSRVQCLGFGAQFASEVPIVVLRFLIALYLQGPYKIKCQSALTLKRGRHTEIHILALCLCLVAEWIHFTLLG